MCLPGIRYGAQLQEMPHVGDVHANLDLPALVLSLRARLSRM